MQTNKLNNEARNVLLAIIKDGAKSAEPHTTTVDNIALLLNWNVGGTSNDKLSKILHELLTSGYSVQNGESIAMGSYISGYEFSGNGILTITVNIPESLVNNLA